MNTDIYPDMECVVLENKHLQLLVPHTIGPRIISLRFHEGKNLLAELPDFVYNRPDGIIYHFYGGHRLWVSPEDPVRSYSLDDLPVEISRMDNGLLIRKTIEPETGIEKAILLELEPDEASLTLTHHLTNRGLTPVKCAPWGITQFRTGGMAILPQAPVQAGLLPNRLLSLWPYSDISSRYLSIGNSFILLKAGMQTPFKIGFNNTRGWLAYWLDGVLFVKKITFDPQGEYLDYGSSSECFCNQHFLELETIAPLTQVEPGASVTHIETWELYPDVQLPEDEHTMQLIAEEIGLE